MWILTLTINCHHLTACSHLTLTLAETMSCNAIYVKFSKLVVFLNSILGFIFSSFDVTPLKNSWSRCLMFFEYFARLINGLISA